MTSSLYHLQLNIDFEKSAEFYRELMELLGWDFVPGDETMMGFKQKDSADIWFIDSDKKSKSDYDALGVNHIAIKVGKKENVDEVVEFIESKEFKSLFETPRHRPEFSSDEDHTYYQVMFESPDGILFEIVYVGKK